MNNNKLYVAVCHYEGCSSCGEGDTHIVGVFSHSDKAYEAAVAHSKDKNYHLHPSWTELLEVALDKNITKIEAKWHRKKKHEKPYTV